MAGRVRVDGAPATKPGTAVRRRGGGRGRCPGPEHVGRGAIKLAGALDAFGVDPAGRVAVDVGASTGGFTETLLARGAVARLRRRRGPGPAPREAARPTRAWSCSTRVNARAPLRRARCRSRAGSPPWTSRSSPCEDPARAARRARPRTPTPSSWSSPSSRSGAGQVGRGGIVKDPALHCRRVRDVAAAAQHEQGYAVVAVACPSPIAGAEGNREFFLHLRPRRRPADARRRAGGGWCRRRCAVSTVGILVRARPRARPGPTLRDLSAGCASAASASASRSARRGWWTTSPRPAPVAAAAEVAASGRRAGRAGRRRHPPRRQPPRRAPGARAGRELRQPRLPDRDHAARAVPHPRGRAARDYRYEERRMLRAVVQRGAQPESDGRRPQRRGHHQGRAVAHHRAGRDRGRRLRVRVPRRRPHRVLAHRAPPPTTSPRAGPSCTPRCPRWCSPRSARTC